MLDLWQKCLCFNFFTPLFSLNPTLFANLSPPCRQRPQWPHKLFASACSIWRRIPPFTIELRRSSLNPIVRYRITPFTTESHHSPPNPTARCRFPPVSIESHCSCSVVSVFAFSTLSAARKEIERALKEIEMESKGYRKTSNSSSPVGHQKGIKRTSKRDQKGIKNRQTTRCPAGDKLETSFGSTVSRRRRQSYSRSNPQSLLDDEGKARVDRTHRRSPT